MNRTGRIILTLFAVCIFSVGITVSLYAADKMPPEKAGVIGQPEGKIAFIRDKNIWYMNADGTNQTLVTEVTNADGRLSWTGNNRMIMFTRKGEFDVKGPNMMGGHHKLYDLFLAYLDSAEAHNTMFWRRISEEMGSRDPDILPDGKTVIFTKDMNAKYVTASLPQYQICTMNSDGTNVKMLRENWIADDTLNPKNFITSPSMNLNGDVAFVYFENLQARGFGVMTKGNYSISVDSAKILAGKNDKGVAPAWSPDGQWIAYVYNDINSNAVYITNAAQTERYLIFEPPVGTYVYTIPPSFSPDSKWLTFSTTDGSVWIIDITGNGARRLTGPGLDKAPAWSKAATK
ncbi:MAG: TolB family protein [Candidatus Zixiibacteriota bacterium]